MKLSERQQIFTENLCLFIQFAYANGYRFSMGEILRTLYQQKKYVRIGASETLKGKHLDALAFDIKGLWKKIKDRFVYTTEEKDYRILGEYWEKLHKNNIWGGRFGVKKENYKTEIGWDPAHFQG